MKWFRDFKSSYNGWSRSTQLIATLIGLVMLWFTGLGPFVALVYMVLIGKKWWDKRNTQIAPTQFPGNVPPTAPSAPQQMILPPPPSVTPPVTPPPTPPNRPVIDWNKP